MTRDLTQFEKLVLRALGAILWMLVYPKDLHSNGHEAREELCMSLDHTSRQGFWIILPED